LFAAENRTTTDWKAHTSLSTLKKSQSFDRQYVLTKASRELRNTSLRQRFLPQDFSSGPIWITLLSLLANGNEGAPVRISDVGRSSGVSTDTATRQIAALIEAGLVVRIGNEADQWDPAIALTPDAWFILEAILSLHE
jgi:DNA-binding MarR family transcriptional regulator